MAPGFSFPPPPPPPPKAASASNDQVSYLDSQSGFRGGRGGRGNGRGRGGSISRGNASRVGSSMSYTNYLPEGTHVNPAFQHDQRSHGRNSNVDYGQKRKRDDGYAGGSADSWRSEVRRDHGPRPHPMSRPENKPKVQVAPAVPSFGSPLFQAPLSTLDVTTARPGMSAGQSRTRLGLVPRGDEADEPSSESEEDDNVDEEAAFEAVSTGPMTFEYNGEVAKLETQADIKAWIEERKKLWPSRRKIDEKQAEVRARMEERRRIEQETRTAFARGHQPHVPNQEMRQQADKSTGSIETQSLLSELDHGLSGAMNHPMVPEAIASQPDVHSDERQIATVTRSQSDDDSAPEEESSRIGPENIVPEVSAKICNAFAATGRCKFGKKCRYQHVRPDNAKPVTNPGQERNTATSKRKTLFNRMVEQEDAESDALALQAIKYLGNLGFFRQYTTAT